MPHRHVHLLCRAYHPGPSSTSSLQDIRGHNVVRLLQHTKNLGILEGCFCIVKCNQTAGLLYHHAAQDVKDVECVEYNATVADWQTLEGASIAWNQLEIGSADNVLQASPAAPFVALPVVLTMAPSPHKS